jgi:glycerophosphoryl diester phosphodiesterase
VGLKALAYTVNQADQADALWMAGLDGLITDRVDLFEPQARLGLNPGRLLQISDVMIEV